MSHLSPTSMGPSDGPPVVPNDASPLSSPEAPSKMSRSPHRSPASPSDASDARRLDDSTSSALIHFAGRWTDEDRTIVERAIRHLESVRTSHAVRNLGEPWVCTFQDLGIGPFYTAHRAGHFQPLTARSARRLAFRLFGLSASGIHSG